METKHLKRKQSFVLSMCLTKCFDHCSQDQLKLSLLSPSPNTSFLFVGSLSWFISNSSVLFKYYTTRLKTNSPTNPTCPVIVQYTKHTCPMQACFSSDIYFSKQNRAREMYSPMQGNNSTQALLTNIVFLKCKKID